MTTEALVEKFRGQARFAGRFGDGTVDALVDRLLDIEGENDVGEVARMARGET